VPWPAREREMEGERKLIRKDRKFIWNIPQDGWCNAARYLSPARVFPPFFHHTKLTVFASVSRGFHPEARILLSKKSLI
jgi:hypothetical protein